MATISAQVSIETMVVFIRNRLFVQRLRENYKGSSLIAFSSFIGPTHPPPNSSQPSCWENPPSLPTGAPPGGSPPVSVRLRAPCGYGNGQHLRVARQRR